MSPCKQYECTEQWLDENTCFECSHWIDDGAYQGYEDDFEQVDEELVAIEKEGI